MTKINLLGELPQNALEALKILREDLGFEAGPDGLPITCRRGEALEVHADGKQVELTWSRPVELYRGLSLIPQSLEPVHICQKAGFQEVGPMFDCSRNAVLTPETMRFFLRKMALMGLNLGMLYTEDTYEVPEQPFFGYKRGRYTAQELKALDDYAFTLGIELCPCIQTLGHLREVLRWPGFQKYKENDEVLLADSDETYALLEQMIRAATAPYRSKKIHLGMDEAFGVGLGKHLQQFGYEDPHAIMGRHLKRVLDITEKLGLDAMMWSDMYFQLEGNGYYESGEPTQAAKDAVDPRATLVYWDYYHDDVAFYEDMLRKHKLLSPKTAFAGGLWNWTGPAIDYPVAIANTVPALEAARKYRVQTVLATMWGDDGAESNLLSALLGLQLYGELTYAEHYEEAALHARFARCCGAKAQAFLDISLLNTVPGIISTTQYPSNFLKIMLYQDPLVQLFEEDTKDLDMSRHYAALVGLYARHARENPNYALLFDFFAALAQTLSMKCRWHEKAAQAVRSGDRDTALALAQDIAPTVEALETLRITWRNLWESTNRPQGFEVLDGRMGAIRARLTTAGEKMSDFAQGLRQDIPELTEPTLPYRRNPDNSFQWTNTMWEITTASKIDFII